MSLIDSIDGMGFTFADLNQSAQLRAIYIAVKGQLSEGERAQIKAALTKAKQQSDANQSILAALLTPTKDANT